MSLRIKYDRGISYMGENRSCSSIGKDMVCIDTYRVLDSCRDKDCYEDVRVFLTEQGQKIIDHICAIRIKSAHVLWTNMEINTMPFNRGFYQICIRIYCKICCEACVAPGNIQEFCGISVIEKKVVLFGSEGSVSVFKSSNSCSGFCAVPGSMKCSAATNLPVAVLETVDPLVLDSKIVEPRRPCCCCCCVDEIPESVCCSIGSELVDYDEGNKLLVSIGLFSVVRLERPAQYLVNGVEYCVPEKECVSAQDEDPCSVFRRMKFPVAEFCPPSVSEYRGCGYDTVDNCKKCGPCQ